MAEEEYRVIHENNTIMDIRKILNKLSEEELEVLKSELDNDIEDAIDSVIDLKNSPSLFATKYKAGDVFVAETKNGDKHIYRIMKIDNPSIVCERIMWSEAGIYYTGVTHYRVNDLEYWEKVEGNVWYNAKVILDNERQDINEIKKSSIKKLTELFDSIMDMD